MDLWRCPVHKIIRYSWRVTGVTLALLLLFQASVLAGIYKWRDDSGKLHFTDDRSKIPLKYQQEIKKFKGAPPPPGTAQKEATEEPSEEQAEEQAGATMSPGAAGEATAGPSSQPPPPNPQSKYTADEKKVMAIVYSSLLKLWGVHVRLVSEVEVKELVRNVRAAEQSLAEKKVMYKNIGKWETPILLKVRAYLKKTTKNDRRLKKNSNKLMEKVKAYRKSLMKDIPYEREMLEEFNVELGLNAKPLITLAESIADFEARRKAKQRKKSGGGAPPRNAPDLARPN